MFLDLEATKKHLNVDSDFYEDDDYITSLIQVAESIVEKHIDTSFEDIVGEDGSIPRPILQAMLLMVGNLYANREAVTFGTATQLPLAYTYLLSLYKRFDK